MADASDLRNIPFRDGAAAARAFQHATQLVSAATASDVCSLLRDVPDPDQALGLLERLLEEHPEAARALERNPVLVHYALSIFAHSQWLGETVIQSPELLQAVLRDKSIGQTKSREHYAEAFARFRSRSVEGDVSTFLARFKRREYVRILLRDVLGLATLSETTSEISALSDVLVAEALRACDAAMRDRYGAPQHVDSEGRLADTAFTVLSLGKLGGNELNYSSDVDLLYVFDEGEAAPGAAISNREYFIRLAQELTAMLSRATREGAPFRIDLRLRPQGGEGEPAVALDHAVDYYAKRAGDWERQALIKVRHSAGDQRLAREFIQRIQPFVYTNDLNFAAIETAVRSREKMHTHRSRTTPDTTLDVKLDHGGIRDVEFLVQCLQRVYGGSEVWLRSGGTMFSLQKLHDKGHITGGDFHQLSSAYEFLRVVEHRLQVRLGQQTHRLPADRAALEALARSLCPRYIAESDGASLNRALRERMNAVSAIYARIIHQQHRHQQHATEQASGYPRANFAAGLSSAGRELSHRQILDRLAIDAPPIYRAAQGELAPHARSNLFRYLGAAFLSAEHYQALLEMQKRFATAMDIFAVSDFLSEVLARNPEEISSLANFHGGLTPAGRLAEVPSDGLREHLARTGATSAEKLTVLRRHYRSLTFASAARDVLQHPDVFDSLHRTTAIGVDAVQAAAEIVECPHGLGIFALGRMGSDEFDILSDADLVFVREECVDQESATKCAVELMQILSAYTRDGSIFPVDARLRPHGAEGELVVTASELLRYFEHEAQPWEALTWTKLRYVAGSETVRNATFSAAVKLLQRFAADLTFTQSVLEMRTRLEQSDDKGNVKTGPGGLYDLDFLAAAELVRNGGEPQFGGDLPLRLEWLQRASVLDATDHRRAVDGARLLRTVEHAIRLVTGTARKSLPASGHAREAIAAFVHASLPQRQGSLAERLERTRAEVREIFSHALGATERRPVRFVTNHCDD